MLVEFSIKAVRLIVPLVQLGGTRERLAALSSPQHKEEKPANSCVNSMHSNLRHAKALQLFLKLKQ